MRNLSDKRLEELAQAMEGGISGISYYLEKGEELDVEDEEILYSMVDVCDTCGWYYDRIDLEENEYGDLLCWRCYEDEEE